MPDHPTLPVAVRTQSTHPTISPSPPVCPALRPLDEQRRCLFAQRLAVLIRRVLALTQEGLSDER
jgi:hypothetical protein